MYYHIEIAGQNICDKSTNIIINPADIQNYEYLKNKSAFINIVLISFINDKRIN